MIIYTVIQWLLFGLLYWFLIRPTGLPSALYSYAAQGYEAASGLVWTWGGGPHQFGTIWTARHSHGAWLDNTFILDSLGHYNHTSHSSYPKLITLPSYKARVSHFRNDWLTGWLTRQIFFLCLACVTSTQWDSILDARCSKLCSDVIDRLTEGRVQYFE